MDDSKKNKSVLHLGHGSPKKGAWMTEGEHDIKMENNKTKNRLEKIRKGLWILQKRPKTTARKNI
jgi:hypothetical protein